MGTLPHEGVAILYAGHHYDRTLALARLGLLPFFWVACFAVYWWGKRYYDAVVAVAAVLLFTFLPPILAHAGVAATDMAMTAFVAAAFLCGLAWVERPNARTAAAFGACSALALVSKMSAVGFLPACAGMALAFYWILERPKARWFAAEAARRLPSLGVAVLAGALLIWAVYRFSFGAIPGGGPRVPAPEFFAGVQAALAHNARGNLSYLFGERSWRGFWYFFPVVLSIKTPLGFLLLLLPGVMLVLRRTTHYRFAWLPLAFSAGILAVGMISHINIGVRHILPVYVGFSLVASVTARELLRAASSKRWAGAALAVAVLWLSGSSLAAHPDYIPYFNELAGSHPENIEVDSDLDWGQDIKRLAARLKEVGAKEVAYNQFIIADLEKQHGFPKIHEMDLARPSPGWNAADLTNLKLCRLGLFDSYPNLRLWPDIIPPTEMVGKSIRLWYVPYPQAPPQR